MLPTVSRSRSAMQLDESAYSSDRSESDDSSNSQDVGPVREHKPRTTLRYYVWVFMNFNPSMDPPLMLQRAGISYSVFTAVLIVTLFIIDSTTAPTVTTRYYWYCELCATAGWSLEYLLRLWSSVEKYAAADAEAADRKSLCRMRLHYASRPLSVLDFLSIVSLIVDLFIESNQYRGVAALRMLRLVTVARIERGLLFGGIMKVVAQKIELLGATLGISLIVMLVASVLMFYIESPDNPQYSSVLQSMWWCTTALTTVGYGDIYPKTGLGQLLGSVVAFVGIGLFAMPAGILAQGFQEEFVSRQRRRRQTKKLEIMHKCDEDTLARLDALQHEVAQMRSEMQKVGALRQDLRQILAHLNRK